MEESGKGIVDVPPLLIIQFNHLTSVYMYDDRQTAAKD